MVKKKISKDMTFGELMELDSEAGMKLAERGLFCGGCPMARFEKIEDGAKAHGVDVEELVKELNEKSSPLVEKFNSDAIGKVRSGGRKSSASLGACDGS